MVSFQEIENHYKENRLTHLKWLTRAVGSPEGAEDILQESYCRCLKYAASCREGEFVQWFNRIVNNCRLDYMKDEYGHDCDELTEEHYEVVDASNSDLLKEILDIVSTKSPVQKEVLELHYKFQYTALEISQLTDYSYALCHKVISRFRIEMRTLYELNPSA